MPIMSQFFPENAKESLEKFLKKKLLPYAAFYYNFLEENKYFNKLALTSVFRLPQTNVSNYIRKPKFFKPAPAQSYVFKNLNYL